MQNHLESIKKASIGSIITIEETLDATQSGLDFFAKLSDYGRKKNCILFESAEILPRYGEKTIGIVEPCLRVMGKGTDFEIKALNELGRRFIRFLKGDFSFCDKVSYKKDAITGSLNPVRKVVDEEERLKLKTHIDLIRKVAFKFKPARQMDMPYCGLFGFISYDFIDQFEDLPENQQDILGEPDYELYFADSMFIMEHKLNRIRLVANALVMEKGRREELYRQCRKKIENYKEAVRGTLPKKRRFGQKKHEISADTTKHEFIEMVRKLKEHIIKGDIYQVVPSRTIMSNYNAEPFDIYKELRALNPSPYMFYINTTSGILLGASPELSLKVQGSGEKIAEIRPIAGTKPRGLIGGKIDFDLDSRYENELKTDAKEIAEHTMLVDLARNDMARISKPGTRYVSESMVIEKYSHVQHLVSNVKGTLKDDLDALHAYLASMNMGTLTGAPKVEAMKLIRQFEKTKRGSYGGCVCYIDAAGNFDSAIVIRSIKIKGNKAYIRAGAGIVHDSNAETEFKETEKKAQACLNAIKRAGGLK
jgi:anthranilate synthase component 1